MNCSTNIIANENSNVFDYFTIRKSLIAPGSRLRRKDGGRWERKYRGEGREEDLGEDGWTK